MAKAKTTFCKSCTVCTHPERVRIEHLRLAGSAADTLADRFDLGRDAIYRHMDRHVSDEQKAALIADVPLTELVERAASEGVALHDYFAIVRKVVIEQLLGAASINDRSSVASLAGRATDVLERIAKLNGQLLGMPSVLNLTNNYTMIQSPQFAQLEAMLVDRLRPFPEALAAVLRGIEELAGGDDPRGPDGPPSAPVTTLEAQIAA